MSKAHQVGYCEVRPLCKIGWAWRLQQSCPIGPVALNNKNLIDDVLGDIADRNVRKVGRLGRHCSPP